MTDLSLIIAIGTLGAIIGAVLFWISLQAAGSARKAIEAEARIRSERPEEPPPAEGISPAIRRAKVLEKENARLREVVKIKDEFLRIVSHELRTPMDAVRGNLDMVLKGDAGEISGQAREYLGDTLEATDRLAKLINDTLDASRLEGGRLKFNLQKVNLAEVIKRTVSELKVLAEKRGLSLIFTPPKKAAPPVWADPEKVEQVLDNLIGNAVKFTPMGTVEVSLKANGESVITSVQDSGIGIREEDLPKLFKRFPQIDNSGVGEKGSGLGLYISSEILAKMGGRIWVESGGRGKGSVFNFTLPAYKNQS